MNQPVTSARVRPRFPARSALRRDLEARLRAYFEEGGRDRRGGWRFGGKALVMLGWWAGSYAALLSGGGVLWTVAWAVSLGLAMGGLGFSVMHDGGHGAASRRGWLNRVYEASVDLIGGSSYYWRHKHGVMHHTFTNVDGVDSDLGDGGFLRLAPTQPWRWYHRYQRWYELPLMTVFSLKWGLYDDWATWAQGEGCVCGTPRPQGWDAVQLVVGKLVFYGWALVIPMCFYPVWAVVGAFLLAEAVLGVVLGVVFQLAHVVEAASFMAPTEDGRQSLPWMEHQLATTVDFAPRSRLISWYVGGLNFQVEHHLFPKISHVHYPAVREIVRSVCAEHGVEHKEYPTLRSAFASHLRLLGELGRRPASAEVVTPEVVSAAA